MQLSFMHVSEYLNQKLRRIGEYNGKSFKGFSKTSKKTHGKIEFHNSIHD